MTQTSAFPAHLNLAHLKAMVAHWDIESHYATEANRVALPIAVGSNQAENRPQTTKIVQLGGLTTIRTIRLRGERQGAWPNLPNPADYVDAKTNIPAKLLRHKIVPQTPKLDRSVVFEGQVQNSQRLYTVAAEFVFALERAPEPGEAWRIGGNLWENISMHYAEKMFDLNREM